MKGCARVMDYNPATKRDEDIVTARDSPKRQHRGCSGHTQLCGSEKPVNGKHFIIPDVRTAQVRAQMQVIPGFI